MPLHDSLVDAELHENKGVAGASANTVATADGAGATVWQKIKSNNIDSTSVFNVNKTQMVVDILDVSTAEKVWVYVPFAGTLTKVGTVLHGAITVADSTLTVKNNAGSSAGTLTVAYTASAAGDIDELTPASNNTFTAGQKLSIETDGASTTAARITVTLYFTITG